MSPAEDVLTGIHAHIGWTWILEFDQKDNKTFAVGGWLAMVGSRGRYSHCGKGTSTFSL